MTRIPTILTCLLLALFMTTAVAPQVKAQSRQDTAVEKPDVAMQVEGIACPMCARVMEKHLKTLDAVDQVQILLGEEKVLLTLKEGKTITKEALSEAVMNASGFKTHKVEFGGGADVTMQVEGMVCPMCARTMEKRLKQLGAVDEVEVLLDEQKVLLTLHEGKTVTEEALRDAVRTAAGFAAHEIEFAKR